MVNIAWSWSRLQKFEQCPFQFKELFITKNFKADYSAPHIVKGLEDHNELEEYVNARSRGAQYPLPEHLNHTTPLLEALVNSQYKLYTELELAFDQNLNRVSWFGKDVWVRIKVDLVCVDFSTGHCLAFDYKTGKETSEKYGKGQLALSSAGIMTAFEAVKEIDAKYLFLKTQKQLPQVYKRDDYDKLWNHFGERSELIQIANKSGNWPKKKNHLCGWCAAGFNQCEFKT